LTGSGITNAQVKLLKPYTNAESTDLLQDWTDASVISSGGDDGVIYYDVSAALAETLGENYQAIFRYTASSLTHYADMLWHVVLHVLDLTVTADDLDNELTSLATTFTDITDAHKNRYIESAYQSIWVKLKANRLFPWAVWDNGGINRCVLFLALAKLCLSQSKSGDQAEIWAWRYNEYMKAYHDSWDNIGVTYAENLEGAPIRDKAARETRLLR